MARDVLVSAIIPVHNTGALVAETLDSVLAQTHHHLEVIVVDDGSTDEATLEQLDRYRGSVRFVRQHNQGAGCARNAGLDVAAGDFVIFIDHDDVLVPHAIETQLAVAARFPGSGMVVCDGVQCDAGTTLSTRLISGAFWRRLMESQAEAVSGDFFEQVLTANPAACPAQVLIPRHVCNRIGRILTDARVAEDYDYVFRVAAEYPLTIHHHSLVRWRYLPTSRSGPRERRRFVWAASRARVLRRYRRSFGAPRRALIDAELARLIGETARRCYHHGRRDDAELPFARGFLARWLRSHPSAVTAMYLMALWTPEDLVSPLARVGRAFRCLPDS